MTAVRFRTGRRTLSPDAPMTASAVVASDLVAEAVALAREPLPPDPGEDWRPWDVEGPEVAPAEPDPVEDAPAGAQEPVSEPLVASGDLGDGEIVRGAFGALSASYAAYASSVETVALKALGYRGEERETLVASAMGALRDLASRTPEAPHVEVHVPATHIEVHQPDFKPEVHVAAAEAPQVHVTVPEQPAPQVTFQQEAPAPVVIPAPVVNVQPTPVTVQAPVVNVTPEIELRVPDRHVTVERDRYGQMTGATIEEEEA